MLGARCSALGGLVSRWFGWRWLALVLGGLALGGLEGRGERNAGAGVSWVPYAPPHEIPPLGEKIMTSCEFGEKSVQVGYIY